MSALVVYMCARFLLVADCPSNGIVLTPNEAYTVPGDGNATYWPTYNIACTETRKDLRLELFDAPQEGWSCEKLGNLKDVPTTDATGPEWHGAWHD